jgi:cysteine sulfinate desulfinase/cysteine desulfurase-like protein
MGLPPERVQSSLRLSLGHDTTDEEVDRAARVIAAAVAAQRSARAVATEPRAR